MKENISKKGEIGDDLSFFLLIISLVIIFIVGYKIAEPIFEKNLKKDIPAKFDKVDDNYFLLLLAQYPGSAPLAEDIILAEVTGNQYELRKKITELMPQLNMQGKWAIEVSGNIIDKSENFEGKDDRESTLYVPLPLGLESDKKITELKLVRKK